MGSVARNLLSFNTTRQGKRVLMVLRDLQLVIGLAKRRLRCRASSGVRVPYEACRVAQVEADTIFLQELHATSGRKRASLGNLSPACAPALLHAGVDTTAQIGTCAKHRVTK